MTPKTRVPQGETEAGMLGGGAAPAGQGNPAQCSEPFQPCPACSAGSQGG